MEDFVFSLQQSLFSFLPRPPWVGQAAFFSAVIVFKPLLDVPGGPKGINYSGRYRPRTQGGREGEERGGFGGFDQVLPELDHRDGEEETGKWNDGGGFPNP